MYVGNTEIKEEIACWGNYVDPSYEYFSSETTKNID